MFKKKLLLLHCLLIILFISGCQDINKATTLSQNIAKDDISVTNNVKKNNLFNTHSNFKKAKVYKVIDGDTILLTTGQKVRLIGVNCPEDTTKHEEFGREATLYTKSILESKTIYLEKDIREVDKYNRLLRYVWLDIPVNNTNEEIKAKMFNAALLMNGFAQQNTFPPDVKYVNQFMQYEKEARNNRKGLWKIDPNGTTKGDIKKNIKIR